MTRRQAIVLFAAAPFAALAKTNESLSLDELMNMGQQLVKENVDEDLLAQLNALDQEKIRALLHQLQDKLDQDTVLDLARLKETATTALKLFDSNSITAQPIRFVLINNGAAQNIPYDYHIMLN